MPVVPFKLNQNRRHHIPRQQPPKIVEVVAGLDVHFADP